MNKEISRNYQRMKINYLDLLFFVLLSTTFYFTRNIVCRVVMLLFFSYFLVVRLSSRNAAIKPSFFFISYSAFIGYGAIMLIFGDVINAGVVRTMVISLVLNLLMIYCITIYIKLRNDITAVIKTFEWSIFIVAFIVVVMSLSTITSGRLGGGTEINANVLAMLCVYGIIMCSCMLKNNIITPSGFCIKAAFYLLAVFLTGSRKGLLMIVVAAAVIMIINERKKLIFNILKILAVVAVLYLVVTQVPFFYNIIGHRVEDLLMLLTENQTTDYSLINRQRLIVIGLDYINENKWLGYGLDCFKLVSGISGTGSYDLYSHNNYIELLFGSGIIGLVLYYIPMLWILIKLIKQLRRKAYAPYLLALFVSKLAVEYAYVSYYSRIDAYIIAVIIGILLHWDSEDNMEREEKKWLRYLN